MKILNLHLEFKLTWATLNASGNSLPLKLLVSLSTHPLTHSKYIKSAILSLLYEPYFDKFLRRKLCEIHHFIWNETKCCKTRLWIFLISKLYYLWPPERTIADKLYFYLFAQKMFFWRNIHFKLYSVAMFQFQKCMSEFPTIIK